MSEATDDMPKPQSIGIILVHGIGEQRRFEHLDGQGRQIIEALRQQPDTTVTVEIVGHPAAGFHAEQDTWSTGASGSVRAIVKTSDRITHIFNFYEVWWADINERYSLAKQIRFWLWGLAVWAYPHSSRGRGRVLHGTGFVTSPIVPNANRRLFRWWMQFRLFAVGFFFFVAAFSLGPGLLLLQRLLNLKTPDVLKTLTNYISGVKLFNQRHRFGPGFSIRPPDEDLLDTLQEPPRVSVRRRMIRAIAQVALAHYDRWYIVAHSQGTVAAFNGLMETPYAWPGYFTEQAWDDLVRNNLAGPANRTMPRGATMPARPVWATPDAVAYRQRIFERFHGLLTLGSPLEKFAAIWPARVPIARLPAFRPGTTWINVFDPLDPVSGVLKAYDPRDGTLCPGPRNIGYPAYWLLLAAHLRYLTWRSGHCLARDVARWFLNANADHIQDNALGYFGDGTPRARRRWAAALLWWLVAFLLLSAAGTAALHGLAGWWWGVGTCQVCPPPSLTLCERVAAVWHWVWQRDVLIDFGLVTGIAFVGTVIIGALSRVFLFDARGDVQEPDGLPILIDDVEPDAPGLREW
jgi:hypothetical protein